MNLEDLQGLLSVLGVSVVGILAWIWRLGRRDQRLTDRVSVLEIEAGKIEAELAAQRVKRSDRDAQFFRRLDEMGREQASQSAQIAHIVETCNETRVALMDVLASRRPGGRRRYDPEE